MPPVGFVADNINWQINVTEASSVGARRDDKIITGRYLTGPLEMRCVRAAVTAAVTDQKYAYVKVEKGSCAGNAYCRLAESTLSSDVAFKNLQIKRAYIGIMLLVYVYRL